MSTEIQVTLNGESRNFPPQTTLLEVVRALQLEPDRVAIEFNRAIARREIWAMTTIGNGAEIEIVQFVGGG